MNTRSTSTKSEESTWNDNQPFKTSLPHPGTSKSHRLPSSSDELDSRSKPRQHRGSYTCLLTPPRNGSTTHMSSFHSLDAGLNELVSKLQSLQAHENDDEKRDQVTPVLDPLPPNAVCPGAPKIPAVFTMPLFAPEDDDCDENENHVPFQVKRVNSHHISPLAEVTEAYTGLQGGWSPPLETTSPLLATYSFHKVAIPPASFQVGPSQTVQPERDLSQGKELGISFYVEKLAPGMKHRREQTYPAVSSNQSPSLVTKGPLRI